MSHWLYLAHVEPVFVAPAAQPAFVPPLDAPPQRAAFPIALAVAACFFVPAPAPAQVLGWEPLNAEPVRLASRLLYETGAEEPTRLLRRLVDWYPALSEPIRPVSRLLAGTGAESPVRVVPRQDWDQPLQTPPYRPSFVPQGEQGNTPFVPARVEVAYWYPQLHPAPLRIPSRALFVQSAFAPDFPVPPRPPAQGDVQIGIGQKRTFSSEPILGGGGSW